MLQHRMDLNFTAEELAFRQEIRAWVAENLPQDIRHNPTVIAAYLGADEEELV